LNLFFYALIKQTTSIFQISLIFLILDEVYKTSNGSFTTIIMANLPIF